jgi:hypothetical protein
MQKKTIQELIAQKKRASREISKRTSIARVLIIFGIFLVFSLLLFISILAGSGFSGDSRTSFLIITAAFGAIFIILSVKYKKSRTSEERERKLSPWSARNIAGSTVFLMILLGLLIFSVSLFFTLFLDPRLATFRSGLMGQQMLTYVIISVFFSAVPFLMALWFRISPRMAARVFLRVHGIFHKRKDTDFKVLVVSVPNRHSVLITLKRALNWVSFSALLAFGVFVPVSGIGNMNFDPGQIDQAFAFATTHFSVFTLATLLSFVLFSFVMPPCYLLDDAGVVFYRRFTARRQPPEIKTISSWFLSFINGAIGSGALISYVYYVATRFSFISAVSSAVGGVAAIQFLLMVFGFPLLGSLAMALILLLFQEFQLPKLKTFMYQELVAMGIDPRTTHVDLIRDPGIQEGTLLKYWGENFFHAPPLEEFLARGEPDPGKSEPELKGKIEPELKGNP